MLDTRVKVWFDKKSVRRSVELVSATERTVIYKERGTGRYVFNVPIDDFKKQFRSSKPTAPRKPSTRDAGPTVYELVLMGALNL